MKVVHAPADWPAFRIVARALLAEQIPPQQVGWTTSPDQLDVLAPAPLTTDAPPLKLPRAFVEAGQDAALHRSEQRWALLYRLAWRLTHELRVLMQIAADPDVAALHGLVKAVHRDQHKMTAFVRFTPRAAGTGERYVAFYRPDHLIVRATSPFFARRFPSMAWSILTPDLSVHHDGGQLRFTEGMPRDPHGDDADHSLWQTYYAHTFNPARLRTRAMRAEMPVRFWPLLPEARLIAGLVRAAPAATQDMIEHGPRPPQVKVVDPPRERAPQPAPLQPPPRIAVGVAGWDYPDWQGRVYAPDAGTDRLRVVADKFSLIEVNSTFYRPVSPKAARHWLARVADLPRFRFTAKLWQRFSHENKPLSKHDVAQVRAGLDVLLDSGRLVTTLLQFPWSFKHGAENRERIARVVQALAGLPIHVEFRHDSWLRPDVEDELRSLGAGWVNIDQPTLRHCIRPTAIVTNRVAYIRLHGRNAHNWFREDAGRDDRFDYAYSAEELRPWQATACDLARRDDVDSVDVVFNNHYRAQAVDNALFFGSLLRDAGLTS